MTNRLELRETALSAGEDTFIWHCGFHGMAMYDAKGGHCILCNLANAHLAPRARAKAVGSIIYDDICSVHGLADHVSQSGKCVACHDKRGRSIAAQVAARGPRALARAAGAATYLGTCERHGETAYSVQKGKCLQCFTTAGKARQWARVTP